MNALDSTHECPSPGCAHRVPFEIFACKLHWYTIPQEARQRLYREWRRNPGGDSYFAARADCLRALGVPEEQIALENAGVALSAATSSRSRPSSSHEISR